MGEYFSVMFVPFQLLYAGGFVGIKAFEVLLGIFRIATVAGMMPKDGLKQEYASGNNASPCDQAKDKAQQSAGNAED